MRLCVSTVLHTCRNLHGGAVGLTQPIQLLIDADMLLFESSIAVEQLTDWGDDIWTYYSDFKDAKAVLSNTLATLEADTGISQGSMRMCLSDAKNFRYDVCETYKWNRKNTRKPMAYRPLKEWLLEHFDCVSYPKLEGDDVIGILSGDPEVGILSGDKDLKQISGFHWDGDDWEYVSEEEGDRFFLYQVLNGDRQDGYSGCPGVGPVSANKILDKDCSWEAVVAAYVKKELSESDAFINAHQARILHPGEYDFEKKEPILWTP